MKKQYVSGLFLFLFGCGQNAAYITSAKCQSVRNGSSVTVSCNDGTVFVLNDGQEGAVGATGATGATGSQGIQGEKGDTGEAGANGHSAIVSQAPADSLVCTNGGVLISMGVDLNDNSTMEPTEVKQVATLCNGLNGSDGTNGQDGEDGEDGQDAVISQFAPIDLVNFCGNSSLAWSEVGFRLANGTIVASFSENANGKNTRWTVIRPGSYITTDGYGCNFTVTVSGQIVN